MAIVPCVHLLWLQTLTQPTLHQKTETRHTVHKVKDGFVCTIFPFFFLNIEVMMISLLQICVAYLLV